MRLTVFLIMLSLAGVNSPASAEMNRAGMVLIPAGQFSPFFQPNPGKGKLPVSVPPVEIGAFWLDVTLVTNAQFHAFVRAHPDWGKSQIKPVFADSHYLNRWTQEGDAPDAALARQPVTNVSWFAAQAYCTAQGKSLPTTDQWEYALADQGRNQAEVNARSLDWFGAPNSTQLAPVGQGIENGFGVQDLVGLVWEWTFDFDSFMTGTELRNTDSKDNAQFCGNGSTGVKDAADYPGFMRYALRTSLKATYTTDNVGFRCAGEE